MEILALADDLTGALEVGAHFAATGVQTSVVLRAGESEATAVVIDAETRHLPSLEAARVVRECAQIAPETHLFKKTDSTLRGQIAAELQSLLEVRPHAIVVYAPAYPEMGRTVECGILRIYGQPLGQTPFAHDPLNPATEGGIVRMLRTAITASVRLVEPHEHLASIVRDCAAGSIVVCDGSLPDDIATVARAMFESGRPCIAAGTGALAREWVRCVPVRRGAAPGKPFARRWLALCGTLHPASREQTRAASHAGWRIIATPEHRQADAGGVSRALAQEAIDLIRREGIDGILVLGGDTAYALLTALGVASVTPACEVLPGVPLSSFRLDDRPIALLTKAGGFGTPDLICRLAEIMATDE